MKIKLNYKGDEYTLEYTRRSVKIMENRGFIAEESLKKPATMLPILFEGAFIAHHPRLKSALVDEIFEEISDKGELVDALSEMYLDTMSTLFAKEEGTEGKNKLWEKIE